MLPILAKGPSWPSLPSKTSCTNDEETRYGGTTSAKAAQQSGSKLFSVMGQKVTGQATAFIIADTESEAEDYALYELAFVNVSARILVSECRHA